MNTIQTMPMALSLLDPLYTAFGWIMRVLYQFIDNYGLAIIFFTILIRAILVPLNVRSHKAMMKQQILTPQRQELERIYAGDKEKFQMAQMELYKQNGVSMTGGCLPMLLQLVLIWPVYRIVSGPLNYIMNVPVENLQTIAGRLVDTGHFTERSFPNVAQMNIPLMQALRDMPSVLADVVNEGLMKASDLMNLNFLGMNLGLNPTISPGKLFGPEWRTWLPLLAIPILAVATTFISSKITEVTAYGYKAQKEERERAKLNPAMSVQDNPQAGMMKSMKYMMPLMTLFFTFSMPAAMGLYWVTGNLLAIVQALFMYYVYTRPVQYKQGRINAMSQAELADYNRQIESDPKVAKRRNKMAARQARMEQLLKQQEAMKKGEQPVRHYQKEQAAKDQSLKEAMSDRTASTSEAQTKIGTPPKHKRGKSKNTKK